MKVISSHISLRKGITADLLWGSPVLCNRHMHARSKPIHSSLAAAIKIQVLGVFCNETISTGLLVIRAVRQF